jgi:hypothetical protein
MGAGMNDVTEFSKDVERVFAASDLAGNLQVQKLPSLVCLLYVLRRTMLGPHGDTEHVVLEVTLGETGVRVSACLEDSGAMIYERELVPLTREAAVQETSVLVAWAKSQRKVLHVRPLPDDSVCEVHDWTLEKMSVALIPLMEARHGKGGVNACVECVNRWKKWADERRGIR